MNIKSERDENIDSFIVKGEYSLQEFSTGGTELEDADGIKFEITEVKENDNEKNNENQCYICGKNFTRQSNLMMHMGIHGPAEMAYNCAHCSSSFMDKNDLVLHIISHTRGNSEENSKDSEDLKMMYNCPHCTKVCKYEKNYFRHLQGHWGAKSYECGICSKKFRWKAYLNRHMTIHLKPESYPCNFCDRSYQRKDHLKQHVLKHVAQFLNCPHCNMVSIEKSDLEEHIKTAHPGLPSTKSKGKDSKKHPCTICKKIFRTPKMLRKHERTHFGRQRLECKTCGQICYEQEELDQHIELEHNRQEGIKPLKRIGHPFLCPHCGKGFRVKSHFLAHLEIHSDDQTFKCGICNKKFKKKQVLTIHMRIHEKGKPLYPCKICERVFKSEKTLIRHEKSHDLEEETMECPDCNGSGYVRDDFESI